MKTSKLILLFMVISLLLSGCVGPSAIAADPIFPTKTEQVVFAATNTVIENTNTPTISITPAETETSTFVPNSTKTPLPTIVKHPPKPTVERPVEWDINPFYEKKIDTEWKGVRIKASILIDESLKDRVISINMMDSLLAEIVARTVFFVWYSQNSQIFWQNVNNSNTSSGFYYLYDDSALYSYMELWSKAQKTGDYSDWRKVQINGVWANDLTDGNGYVPQPYNFWPMYEGETPQDVKSVKEFVYVITDVYQTKNISVVEFVEGTVVPLNYSYGFSKNISGESFLFTFGMFFDDSIFEVGSTITYMEDYYENQILIEFIQSSGILLSLQNQKRFNSLYYFEDFVMYKSIKHWGIKIKLTSD